ncbi:SpoIIE family protein phosphatase [Kitasatospora sp. NPDC058965]|uniref:ATP-binding SpoIIE family protein phosphatase n=1 Tax=Kitasatospora sp. NPDC058965 TaxID=3346682 RepID=UPI00367DFBE1
MPSQLSGAHGGSSALDGVAALLLSPDGTVTWWSRAATELLGWDGAQVLGRPAAELLGLALPVDGAAAVRLRHRAGHLVAAEVRALDAGPAPGTVLLLLPGTGTQGWEQDSALSRTLLHQDRIAIAELDRELRIVRTNTAFDALRPAGASEDWFGALTATDGTGSVRELLAEVAGTGRTVVGVTYRCTEPGTDLTLSLTCFRLEDPPGTPVGVAVAATDVPEQRRAALRTAEAYRRTTELGGSLDVVAAARELVEVLVPTLGELASVDLPDYVLQGQDPPLGYPGAIASAPRRVAAKSADGHWPLPLVQVGEPVPVMPELPETAAIAVGGVIRYDREAGLRMLGHDPVLLARLMPERMRTALGCPLYHRSRLFGFVLVYRTRDEAPFDHNDTTLLQDLCHRTAVALDNAFRYTREHQTAVVLQRSLLPPAATESTACETAGAYLPAGGSPSVGGDWYDAFPLSSARTALVIGDVIGHGLAATATMARLRTAVQTLAELDLPPDELLTRLDDLVTRIGAEADQPDTVGASCLFAVYDPVRRELQAASAGHPPPAVVLPDGAAEFLPVVPGPPLGVGDNPFEVCRVTLPPGSVLALFTNGLVGRDLDTGMPRLLTVLGEVCRPGQKLDDLGAEVLGRHPAAERPDDDVTLLLARTRSVLEQDTAVWEYPADLAQVQTARADVTAQLAAWDLAEQAFATELMVSELVTNAIRYAGGPVVLRLIRARALVCEVSDPSNTQPRLRRALDTDEGGRGLFLVAQLSDRWGCRYGASGKTIWTEQALPT